MISINSKETLYIFFYKFCKDMDRERKRYIYICLHNVFEAYKKKHLDQNVFVN